MAQQSMAASVLQRELLLSARNPAASLNAVWFFVLVCGLFAIGIGPDKEQLAQLAPGLIWVIALLAVMLSVDALFRHDYADGSLEQLLLAAQPLYFLILARLLAQALLIALPLALISPLLSLMLGMNMQALPALIISLLIGVPTLVLVGAIGAALTVGFERGGLLLALLILPLYVPVLIFASAAVVSAASGFDYIGQILILAAQFVLALALSPLAVVAGLRLNYYH
ncbi:MAG: heme exporter protein CcmB [Pseudomonadales bacterium]